MCHPDIEQEAWADEIEREEEPKRIIKRAPDVDPHQEELKDWASLD